MKMKNLHKFGIKLALIASLAVVSTACDENYWNEHELDGFEEPVITDVKSIEYTMSDYDYKIVADNSTNKSLASAAGLSSALTAVGNQHYFTEQITAREYVPALLSDPKFPYFALSDGSSIKMTYRTAQAIPDVVAKAAEAKRYTVSDENYQSVWGSDNDYVASFAPSHTAASAIPGILKEEFPDAAEGDYVIVNYETAQTDPVFNAASDGDTPEFTLSDVIATVALDEDVTINGYISAMCAQGFIVTDASGSMLVYRGSKFESDNNYEGFAVGDRVVINGTIGSYNKGFQVATGATIEKQEGTQEITYPAAVDFTGAYLDNFLTTRTDNAIAIYGKMTGTVKVSGNNVNINVDGASTAVGSVYQATTAQKAQLVDGSTVEIEGYLITISGTKYCNIVPAKITATTAAAAATTAASRAASVKIASTNENAIYTYNGSKWVVATDFTVLSHADYQAMGQSYDNLENDSPAQLLPIYLKTKFPYAQADDVKYVVYFYYASSATSVVCDPYKFDGSAWLLDNGVVTETAQFVRTGGKWIYDPNVTITLPAGRGVEISTLYYQTCVDWVKNNIDTPTGATYVTSYGNNEYYSGTSAYQGNVDLRPSAARTQYAAGYADMTDEQIVEVEKQRFATEVMPAALGIIHADADLVPGIDVVYTINFAVYTGSTSTYTIKFKLVGKGKFEFMECDW